MNTPSVRSACVRKVLVTGAGGFVGSQVALGLAQAGYEVVVTDQAFDAATRARLSDLRRVEAPLPTALAQLSDLEPFAVIHGAALTAGPAEAGLSSAAHVRVNVDLLTGCLVWARSQGAARFFFLSSTGVFGPQDGSDRVTELSPATGDGPYASAKRAGEIVTKGAAEPGFSTLSLRLGNLFGLHEVPRPSRPFVSRLMQMVREANAGTIRLTSPQARREWTWLPDIGRAAVALLNEFPSAETPILHCGNTVAWSDLELAQAVVGFFPDARIEMDAPYAPAATKAPMGSAVSSVLSDFAWTPLTRGLADLFSERAAA